MRRLSVLSAVASTMLLTIPSAARADEVADPPATSGAAPVAAAPAASTAAPADAGPPPICADRPTKANNACTVDFGHFQLETDLFNGTFSRQGGVTTDLYYITNPTLKYGLSKDMDIEINLSPYELVRTHDKFGNTSTIGGVGDLYVNLKYNFYNSGDGKIQIAAIPYVKAPVARMGVGNGAWEGGVIVPASYKLNDTWSVSIQPELDTFKDDDGSGHHVNTSQLIDVSYSLPHTVTLFAELWGSWNFDPAGTVTQYSADIAASWGVTNSLQLDGGLNFGLNKDTPGVQVYMGVSQKF